MNIDLPKLKAKLPRLPKDLSRRDILSLVGVAIVLLAIPLTVILFRRYQETRIKAYGDAQIVEGTVKITNIHAYGFTVSWATVGQSKGYVIWGPAEGGLTEKAYDDRATGTDTEKENFPSSTHHVTLPYPPGDDRDSDYFANPAQAYDLKIMSGDGKAYGGTFDAVGGFDVIDVTESASPIQVTTGPELSTGLPDGSLSAIKLVSDRPIAAINNTVRRTDPTQTFSYSAVGEAGRTIFLPFFAKNAALDPFKGFGSTLQIQNTSEDSPATVTLHFYSLLDGTEVGNPGDPSQHVTIPPNGFRQWWWKDNLPSLPDGFLGSVVVESDQNITVVAITKGEMGASGTGGNFETGAYSGFTSSQAAQTYYLPMFAKGYEGYDSNIHIQNTGSVRTYFTAQFYNTDGGALGFTGGWIPAKSSFLLPASELLPPDPVPSSSLSSVLIQTHDDIDYPGFADGENIVATVFNINTDPGLSFAYSGLGFNNVHNTQFSPLFTKNFYDQYSTMYIENTDQAQPAVVTMRFHNAEGVAQSTVQHTIQPRSLLTIDASTLAELPEGFLGTVLIESDGPKIAAVTKASYVPISGVSYANGFANIDISATVPRLYFPLYSNNFHDQISSIQVQNAGGHEPANVCFYAYDAEGSEVYSECVSIPRWGFHQFYAPSLDKCGEPLPAVAPGCPDPVYGDVKKSSGVAAPGTIVYTTVRDSDGNLSAPLSTITSNKEGQEGTYTLDLGNARTRDRSAYFSYDRNTPVNEPHYWEDLSAQGGVDGVAELIGNPTNNDQPIPTLILNRPPVIERINPVSPPNNYQTAIEGQEYRAQVVASDEDGDTLTYGLDSPPSGMTIDQSGLISWPNPTPAGVPCGGLEWGGYCWYEGADGQDCTTVCATHGGNVGTCQENDNSSCDLCHLFHPGAGCMGINETFDPTYFPYFDRCDYRASPTSGSCSTSNPSGRRFCACAASYSPGTFDITVSVNDGKSGGLVTEEYTLTVVESVDTTPPETEIVSGPAEGETVRTDSVTFTYTGTDNITATPDLEYSYRLDTGSWSTWSGETSATLSVGDGTHTFRVKARDEALIEDSTPDSLDTRSFTVDTQGPAIDHTPVTTAPENQDIEIKATITDPSGVASIGFCQRKSDSGAWGCSSFPFTGGLFSTHIPAEAVTRAGVDYYITALDKLGNLSSHPAGAPPAFHHINITDATAPAAITDLTTSNPTNSTITLTWTAPGDDGSTGTAAQYDLRYSTLTISDANWGSATTVTGEPTPKVAGSTETFVVTNLAAETTYYFAIKTADEVPLWSGLSNIASGTTLAEPDLTPHIDSITPNEGPIGTRVTISGRNFGATRGTGKVIFTNNVDATTYDSWSDTQIVTYVPEGAAAGEGNVVVRTNVGTSNGVLFTVTQPPDTEAPVITHTPVTSADENQAVTITATITDNVGVASATLYYKKSTDASYTSATMTASGNSYSAAIPAAVVTQAGVDYYIKATDAVPLTSIKPDLTGYHINVNDKTAPAAITNLAVTTTTTTSATLTWTAPGDDGSTGTANGYDLRYSTSAITDASWGGASPAAGEPTPKVAGSSETFTVTGLAANTTYYFAIKSRDEVPNWSALSNVASGTTKTETVTATLNISLLMQGRPSYPSDSRGSSGTVDIFARKPGETTKLWEADDLAIAADGTASNISLTGLSVGTAYEFLLKGYIHLQVKKPLTLSNSNTLNFGTLLVGDIAGTSAAYANRDDKVNAFDYEILRQGWETTWNNPQPCPSNYANCKLADFNLDSKVNAFDYDYIFTNWNKVGNE